MATAAVKKTRRKRCIRCDVLKLPADFAHDKRVGGRYPWCKVCSSEYQKTRRKLVVVGTDASRTCPVCDTILGGTHPNRRYDTDKCKIKAQKWSAYGLTVQEGRAMVVARGENCPICQCKVKRWALDHNHKDGSVLGYVCMNCNLHLLAYSKHDSTLVKALADFLTNPPIIKLFGVKKYVGEMGVSQLHRMWLWNGKPKQDDVTLLQ